MGMSIPYELAGRTGQKARTRDALIASTRELLAEGVTPTVEQAAAAAAISRTTAYRYFPNQRALLVAAHPETEAISLLDDGAPEDGERRFELAVKALSLHPLVPSVNTARAIFDGYRERLPALQEAFA